MADVPTLLIVVGVVCLVVLAWAGRKRFPLRIGAGNFFRRKTQVAIVVAGLLIGTAIISSSFIIQTTFDYTVRSAVFRALDAVDEVVELMKRLHQEKGLTFIVVTHDSAVGNQMQRVILMRNGTILKSFRPTAA